MTDNEIGFSQEVPDHQAVLEMVRGEREWDEDTMSRLQKGRLIQIVAFGHGFEPHVGSSGGNVTFQKDDLRKVVRSMGTGNPEPTDE
jgi:hypothetical protein